MKRLALDPGEYRYLATRAVDLTAELLEKLPELPSFPQTTGEKSVAAFDSPLPEQGVGRAVMDDIAHVFAHSRPPSPRFFGYVLGSGEPVAALADLIASVLNQNVTAWRSAPAAVTIELQVLRWVAQALGCEAMSGSLCGGGSAANLMALAMAREAKLPANDSGAQPGIFYASTEVHMSIPKAIALM